VTLQYLQTKFPYTRFTEKNKVWAKDVLFIMNFKCAHHGEQVAFENNHNNQGIKLNQKSK